jgi:outer membrane lipoprotein carrier protein
MTPGVILRRIRRFRVRNHSRSLVPSLASPCYRGIVKSLLLPFLLPALPFVAGAQVADRPPVMDVARSVQRSYENVRDFSADFVHSYVGGVLGQQVTERGTVLIKKPWKMRWTYTNPEKKVFVSDGLKLYSYIPQDKQVIISSLPTDETSTPTLFLAGKGNITRDFLVSWADVPHAPDTYALKLVPTRREPDYESLVLVVDRKTFQLRMLMTTDRQGGRSTFTFSKLRENINLPDKDFTFQIPRGVEVVNSDSPIR